MITNHHQVAGYVHALESERSRQDGRHELDALVSAAASGEHAAWRLLINRFRRRLTGLARAHRLPAEDVEDVVQTTFTKLYEHIDTLRDPRALPGWLDTTARRECLRAIKAAGRERPLDTGLIENLPARDAEPEPFGAELTEELTSAVNRLPAHQRRLITALYADDEPSYQQLSEDLAMPIGSIGPTRGRALERLRMDPRLAAAAEALEPCDGEIDPLAARSWAVPS
jgi:RNA polymerase sigma factor (sigma-70 family)